MSRRRILQTAYERWQSGQVPCSVTSCACTAYAVRRLSRPIARSSPSSSNRRWRRSRRRRDGDDGRRPGRPARTALTRRPPGRAAARPARPAGQRAIDARDTDPLASAAQRADELVGVDAAAAPAERVDHGGTRAARRWPCSDEHRERMVRPARAVGAAGMASWYLMGMILICAVSLLAFASRVRQRLRRRAASTSSRPTRSRPTSRATSPDPTPRGEPPPRDREPARLRAQREGPRRARGGRRRGGLGCRARGGASSSATTRVELADGQRRPAHLDGSGAASRPPCPGSRLRLGDADPEHANAYRRRAAAYAPRARPARRRSRSERTPRSRRAGASWSARTTRSGISCGDTSSSSSARRSA